MKQDLTSGDLKTHILGMAIPASIGMFFQAMYNITDAYYIGHLSIEALAALSLTFPLYFMILAIGGGVGSAVTALVAKRIGAQNFHDATSIIHQSITLSLALSVVFMALGILLGPLLYEFMGAHGEVLAYSKSFMDVIFWTLPLYFLSMLANGILSARGDTKRFGTSLVLGFFINLVLDPVFMYGWFGFPVLGIAGVALATSLTQLFNLVYMGLPIVRANLVDFRNLRSFALFTHLKELVHQSVPSSLNYASTALGFLIITRFVSSYGDVALATYGIGTRIDQLIILPCLGLAIATVSIVGQNFGARKWDRIKEHYRLVLTYGIGSMAIGVAIVWIFAPSIAGIFSKDPSVIFTTVEYLRITSFGYVAIAVMMISRSMLQGLTKASHSLAISLMQIFVISIPAILVFSYFFDFGEVGIWFGILTAFFATAAIAYWYVIKIVREESEKSRIS